MMPDLSFHHGGVSVPDLDAAVAWYRDMLGFEEERRFRIEAANADVAFVRHGTLRFELFEVAGAAALPQERRVPISDLRIHGTKHLAFAVPDFEGFVAEMERKGADIAMIVREDFGKGCFIRDCAGNLVEFVEA